MRDVTAFLISSWSHEQVVEACLIENREFTLLWDRIVAGWCALFMRLSRLTRSAIVLKPSTLLHLQQILTKCKYRSLFSPNRRRQPGPKGPKKELIDAVVELKRRNPQWGCPRIAQQIALAFGVEIDKDVVRRILGVHYRPESDSGGPS